MNAKEPESSSMCRHHLSPHTENKKDFPFMLNGMKIVLAPALSTPAANNNELEKR